jgi:hypothetical protein
VVNLVEVTCTCGEVFQARSAKARYCSDRCRKRKGKADVIALELTDAPPPEVVGVEAATIAELTNAGRIDTALGQTCLTLARRLDRPGLDTGSALASVAARLDDLLAKATRGAKASSSQQLKDELAERRAKHG